MISRKIVETEYFSRESKLKTRDFPVSSVGGDDFEKPQI